MKILLISLQPNTDTIGLKYIHSYLRKNGVDSHILFLPSFNAEAIPVIKDFVQLFTPGIVGISLMSDSYDKAQLISSEIKKAFPQICIVWGGIHPSIAPEECLNSADYVFIGESEVSFLEFATALDARRSPRAVLNLAFRESGRVVINALRPLNNDLDVFPFPEHHPEKSFILHRNRIVPMDNDLFKKYSRFSGRFYSLITIRGCPFSCSYCCNSFLAKLYGVHRVRERRVDNVIEELSCAIKLYPDIVYVIIHDDDFFAHGSNWIKDFAEKYQEQIRTRFICCGTPNTITEEKIRLLKASGLSWIFIGLQSGSERTKKDIYLRSVPNEKLLRAAHLTNKYTIAALYDIILDNPFETEEDILETINLILKIPRPFQFQLYSLTFYQGTEIYAHAVADNLPIENPCSKNYFKYKHILLNKIIRMCPLLPKSLIAFLVAHRHRPAVALMTTCLYPFIVAIIEPVTWLRLILFSFDYRIIPAMDMIGAFARTGFSKLILRRAA
ncbi:MAG: radical SAM protein [Candidatus Aureabacteria bacterium]|nr:radical SAM protein [Candidatus Auribacterota bacterium]